MRYTRLGSTGMRVSRICLGCMTYGDPAWRPWILDEASARPIFERALELGINFFDTADMYSLGVSEEVTGRALREMADLDEVVLASKVYFPMSDAPNQSGLSRKHIVQACEASLRRLGVDAIDLYQIHRFDPETPLDETLAALDHLVQSGKVRYLGASSGSAWRLAQALGRQALHDWAPFVSMQNHYNLIYREEEREMMPLCEEAGIGVIPWSPLARGLLARGHTAFSEASTGRARQDTFGHTLYDDSHRAIVRAVIEVAQRHGVEPVQIALAWLLAKPAVAAPIVGISRPDQLDGVVRALDVTLSESDLEELERPYRPQPIRGH